jgi:hypothetical protein
MKGKTMFLRFTEAYEDVEHYNSALGKKKWLTRDISVNLEHVDYLRREEKIHWYIQNDEAAHTHFEKGQKFTRISVNRGMGGQEIVVLGSLEEVEDLITSSKKKVLKG